MKQLWHTAAKVFDGRRFFSDHAICVVNGLVTDFRPVGDLPESAAVERHDGFISPGLFDIQVNGGGGVLLNTDPTVEGVKAIAAAHRRLGTTALLPTVISDQPDVTQAAVEACLAARVDVGVMGVHIEGPHISMARRGTHHPDVLRDMDRLTIDLVSQVCELDFPVLITVAPEAATPNQISELVEIGAVVSIGHSDANADETQAAVEAGATCFTHLYNAMSQMQGRAPGVVGTAISSDAWCSIIADGIHVDPKMIDLAIQARPKADRMIVVSDAMPTVGGPERFSLYGKEISLINGHLVNDEGSLAGAHLTMLEAVRNLVAYGVPVEDAMQMGRFNPACLMGLWIDMQLIGSRADDLILLTNDLELVSVGLRSV